MPRRREVRKREIIADPKYHDALIAKFINGVMRRGKKSVAGGRVEDRSGARVLQPRAALSDE